MDALLDWITEGYRIYLVGAAVAVVIFLLLVRPNRTLRSR